MEKFDFSGWATRNNLRCSDGRVIMKDAFKHDDGHIVPLVWNHRHNEPFNVLGHALLENRNEGVYAYCKFNDTESGKAAKILVEHGDVSALSIFANQLKQNGGNVLHGEIREVSLVLAGANPGAFIDSVLTHGEEVSDAAVIYTGEELYISHANKTEESTDDENETIADVFNTLTEKQKTVVYALIGQALEDAESNTENEEAVSHSDGNTENNKENDKKMSEINTKVSNQTNEETVEDVFNTLTEKQKTVVYALIGQALEDAGVAIEESDEEGDNTTMKHNVFEKTENPEELT